MSFKPVQLFSHAGGPNPWKVVIILMKLEVPYASKDRLFDVLHTPSFEQCNPNGWFPIIIDPNNGQFTLWESGAIIEYLLERHDTKNLLHSPQGNKSVFEKQYLHFQMSGQGPYFGQAVWFDKFHHFKRPDAVERYRNEIIRVIGVLSTALKGNEYLVGGRLSYADLVFLPWFWVFHHNQFQVEFDAYGKAL